MVQSAVLGFPRIGPNRELKKATEAYWNGKTSAEDLLKVGKEIREQNWKLQKEAGVDIIASNDFSFYDQVLDLSVLFNVIPDRYTKYQLPQLDVLFAMGRGLQRKATGSEPAVDVTALEMVKWFDSNYHYVRPTFGKNLSFKLNGQKPVDEFLEAKALGIQTRPVLVGPVSYLYLGKADKDNLELDPISLLDQLLPLYTDILQKLAAAGATEVQLDEPTLVLDLPTNVQAAVKKAYTYFGQQANLPKITLASYFGTVVPNLESLKGLPVSGFHFDFVRAPEQFNDVVSAIGPNQTLSVGIVDGRNIWKNNFTKSSAFVQQAIAKLGADRVIVATSSSLLHTPVDLENESKLDAELKNYFSFATQKLGEVVTIAKNVSGQDVSAALQANSAAIAARSASSFINDQAVKDRVSSIDANMSTRAAPFPQRLAEQQPVFKLPLFPTTTIGSFPQTKDIRINRNKFNKGQLSAEEYEKFINSEIERVIRFQEEIDLDVLVHGEPERNDMVQYFGEQLKGYAFTTNGWVQSYGSRYVRPPIIVGDLSRPKAMSVKESVYAQSITKKHVKGMLTGPITCLRWSFPRDDIDQQTQAYQLALALRDEVNDLEAAGIKIIQVDEPAIREGLPLRAGTERSAYQVWAAEAFRVATSGVSNKTQIHSHFCYSDLDPNHIKALDADVVSIEFSKKDDANYIAEFKDYPNHIGLGLFDIHSPRVPSTEEFITKIEAILKTYPAEKFWVNPDCGLKTRGWDETRESLTHMVEAAKYFRKQYQK
ncbi:similar to Saccharomyces cerevisiae YER091C MET6 Cobalamin-independent methionine synthase, involved in methionine biosynthesis and regeneration [Maudiozyma barnettii]|uniref:5-methyltetrahydropteroyltriglutamate--homocysteine S-methyltransferase n=2 Tax=Maudiozyma barnettii TaxID=61262 RepID=A0A8H2ZED1_9SACH|nr:5-methyltetrahydropteroyltriglutamate-homocysteine S-methyltransferase [Kazachstania barnettii]CAB4252176.1 similar to Saccharomyces cerevisiae YER091C MET6 Cobalamin-independent methionine synthase, involved in methionine biosynthesis and regeneration [Kazachstania barnettii]CAD1778771.1 similar to Saccharomyces cerevisiae YER091C MET6 Cobalamin-independent methionine synthase, involved in methionine biosynthesis and regeneration [Kazachstania barnettii]